MGIRHVEARMERTADLRLGSTKDRPGHSKARRRSRVADPLGEHRNRRHQCARRYAGCDPVTNSGKKPNHQRPEDDAIRFAGDIGRCRFKDGHCVSGTPLCRQGSRGRSGDLQDRRRTGCQGSCAAREAKPTCSGLDASGRSSDCGTHLNMDVVAYDARENWSEAFRQAAAKLGFANPPSSARATNPTLFMSTSH